VSTAKRRAVLIVNRKSRHGRGDIRPVVRQLQARRWLVTEQVLDSPERIPQIIRAHTVCDSVIIAGGDGTLSGAVPALLDSGQALGILPAGTANNFARNLGIPDDWGKAVRIITDGRIHPVNLGAVNGVPFLSLASIGLSTDITRRISDRGKGKLGLLAYFIAALKSVRAVAPFPARIRCGETTLDVRTIQLAVGNGRYFGAGLKMAPDSAVKAKRLYLYSVEPLPFHRLVALGVKMLRGTQVRDKQVLILRNEAFDVFSQPSLAVDTDGEITTHTPARFRVLPDAIRVYVPTHYRASDEIRP